VGWTSHDVVAVVRRRLGQRSVGHTGTLDPFATGLLVVMVGRATRLARFIEASSKRYEASIRFGTATDTDDGTGEVIRELVPEQWPDRARIEAALEGLLGTQHQRPPAYSAKHVAGRRSHELARAGVAVELPPATVQVHRLEIRSWHPPDLDISAEVGKGTYLRALARDLGERLSIPAHCRELRRTAIGPFDVADSFPPDHVSASALLPAAEMVRHLTRVDLSEVATVEIGYGRTVAREPGTTGPAALIAPDGRLVAVAEEAGEAWQPVVVLEPAG
jgi:tRNA pseudouridine55 synthase